MAIKINYHDLGNEIVNQIAGYCEYASDVVDAAAEETSQEIVNELRTTSPELSGKYKKSWSYKKIGYCSYKVYNKKHYRLTQLLEKGHALRDGGRSKAIPHIAPVEKEYIEKFRNKAKEAFNL